MTTEISLQEVKNHDNSESLWMVIHDQVYDVTKFIDEHPGGPESLLDFAGKDGTEAFEDVGHSEDARELLKKYKVGVLPKEEQTQPPCEPTTEYHKDTMVYPSHSSCCGPDEENKPKKTWRTFDGSPERCPSRQAPTPHKCDLEGPPSQGRVNRIVVPRESSKLKWALLALAGAIVIGVVIKKYAAKG